jgi:DNA-binding CsgD family transcriptional regulator
MRQAEALLVRRSARSDAVAILRGAAQAAREMGARPLVAEMEQLARRARVDLTADGTGGIHPPGREARPGAVDLSTTVGDAEAWSIDLVDVPGADQGGGPGLGRTGDDRRGELVPVAATGSDRPARAEVELGLPAGLATLTQRELGVLAELAEGRTNREIAGRLFISEKTTGTHVSHILAKLGVRTRGQAAAVLHRSMLPVPPERGP